MTDIQWRVLSAGFSMEGGHDQPVSVYSILVALMASIGGFLFRYDMRQISDILLIHDFEILLSIGTFMAELMGAHVAVYFERLVTGFSVGALSTAVSTITVFGIGIVFALLLSIGICFMPHLPLDCSSWRYRRITRSHRGSIRGSRQDHSIVDTEMEEILQGIEYGEGGVDKDRIVQSELKRKSGAKTISQARKSAGPSVSRVIVVERLVSATKCFSV
ncbi:hypothetical protein ACEPAI_10065 [Sanghuangporus weigelae]